MSEKIDTQGMSGPSTKGCKDNVFPKDANGNPIYPPFNPTPLPLIEPQLKKELKELINQVLDERQYQKKLNGPYDMPDYKPEYYQSLTIEQTIQEFTHDSEGC